jgi:hypothetical protein
MAPPIVGAAIELKANWRDSRVMFIPGRDRIVVRDES